MAIQFRGNIRHLLVTNAGVAQVGSYSVRVTDPGLGRSLDSRRVVLEISSSHCGVISRTNLSSACQARASEACPFEARAHTESRPRGRPFYSVSAGSIRYHLGNNVFGSTDLHETIMQSDRPWQPVFAVETKAAGTLLTTRAGA